MKAVVYDRPESFTVTEVPDPLPGPGQVRVRVSLAGVCGTDLHLHKGEFGPTYPLTPGHEFVGLVDLLGDGVDSVAVGDVVACDTLIGCDACAACRVGRTTFCTRASALGVDRAGAFAEYVVVPAGLAFPVADLDPDTAVLAEPLACVVHGVDVLQPAPGSDVLIFGAGPTGQLLAQLLGRSAGRLSIAAPTQFKLDLALHHGADHAVLMDRADPGATAARFAELAPDGFDIVVDATGVIGVLDQAIPLTRDAGTILVYGMADEAARWSVSPYEIFRRELTIKGSFAQHHSFSRSVDALRRGNVVTDGMITHRFALDDYADVLTAVADSSCLKAVIAP